MVSNGQLVKQVLFFYHKSFFFYTDQVERWVNVFIESNSLGNEKPYVFWTKYVRIKYCILYFLYTLTLKYKLSVIKNDKIDLKEFTLPKIFTLKHLHFVCH